MKRREFLKAVVAAEMASLIPPDILRADTSKKPNIVFLLLDDFGWTDAVCYGSSFYETPNIDRLCAEGMRFTDAYAACPICSPTRGSILSGKYTVRTGLTDRTVLPEHYDKAKLIPASTVDGLPLDEFILPQAMKAGGYTTYFAGKWHVGGYLGRAGETEYMPQNRGFEIAPLAFAGTRYFYPYGFVAPQWLGSKAERYFTDRLTDEPLKFLDEHGRKDKPFLLYLAFQQVHGPYAAKPGLINKYKIKADKQKKADPLYVPEGWSAARQQQGDPTMAGMIETLDKNIGRVLDKIKELGIEDNTVVMLHSDNGGVGVFFPARKYHAPTSNLPLRGGKAWLYEGGIRIPTIVKWPGVTKPGSVCNVPIISMDFYPTMLDVAGLPLRPKQHVDGLSIKPLLKGGKSLDREALYWHYPHYDKLGDAPCGAIRVGDYKLLEFFEDMHVELYNLKEDIGERNNLAQKMPGKAAELLKMLRDWRKSMGAKMPKPNPDYVDGSLPTPLHSPRRKKREQ